MAITACMRCDPNEPKPTAQLGAATHGVVGLYHGAAAKIPCEKELGCLECPLPQLSEGFGAAFGLCSPSRAQTSNVRKNWCFGRIP